MQSSTFSTWTRSLGLLTLAFALLFSLSACDSTDSNEDDDGPGDTPPETVNMSIGDDEVEMNAFFATGENPDTGEEGFVIYFTESDNVTGEQDLLSGSAAFMGREGPLPSPDTYTFADLSIDEQDNDLIQDQFGFVYWEYEGEGFPSRIVVSNSGELTITSSGSDRVAGSFEINATENTFTGDGFREEEVTMSGNFDAGRVDVLIPEVDF
ncbi:MAG: hypothetical protein R6U20_00080 [Longimonas sp.]|uniref:hypothetical protein n=1 Tax=Longimonas sp. TaxID=2039626 RepID=UPI003975C6C7